MSGTAITVGKPWPGATALVDEPGHGWHVPQGMCLWVVDRPTTAEIEGLRGGKVDVGEFARGSLVGLAVRAPGWNWVEMPAFPTADRKDGDDGWGPWLENLTPGGNTRLTLSIVLVDATTKIVLSIRYMTLSPHVTRIHVTEMRDRWGQTVDMQDVPSLAKAWYDTHPTSRDTVKAFLARCHGGD